MFLLTAIILSMLLGNYYLQCLFYGAVNKNAFYTNIHFLFITGGLLLNFLLAIVYRYINVGSPFITFSELPGFYTQGWPIMLQTFVLLYLVYYFIRLFNKKFQSDPNGRKRFLAEVPVVLICGFAISQLFYWIFTRFMVVPEEDMAFLERKLKMILMIDLCFLIVVYALMTAFRIFRFLQNKNLEVARWQKEYTQSQFEAMKNQLNPHFLFNSLNALSSLVYADADLAESFIEKLSRSYRYLLEQRGKPTVSLEQEQSFLDNYLFLLQQRFGKKLIMEVNPIHEKKFLPPHTLMILLDHIMETNIMSASRPLVIKIYLKHDHLYMDYRPQPKPALDGQDTARLTHLKEQFQAVANEPLSMEEHGTVTSIIIPLNIVP